MIKLKRLKVLKYRNVKPGTELHFDDGVNLILGQNASGKTTLLALISAVCRGNVRDFADEEYELEADAVVRGVKTTLHASNRRRHAGEEHAHAPGIGGWDHQWSCASTPPQKFPPMPATWWRYDVTGASKGLINRNAVRGTRNAYRFDESLGAFAAATGRKPELIGAAAPPPSASEREEDGEGNASGTAAFLPEDLDELLWRSEPAHPIFHRSLGAAELDLCRELAAVCDARDLTLRPNFLERRIRDDEIDFKVEGFTFEITRPDGTIIHHDRLSYGQKRLLAFYYYLACNPSVVIADELVNGLHHRWIESCMKAIGDRQAFLTSQNPLLFDYVEFDSVEQVRSRFITCKLEQVDGREYMVWENMSEDDAARFFDAYQAGIEHVGDILITRGMW